MRGALCLAAAAVTLACARPAAPPPSPPAAPSDAVTVTSGADARGALGKRVRVTGKAENAKLSAIVMAGDLVVYCLDIQGWPDELRGFEVTAEGVLEQTDQFRAQVSPDGAISQGTAGGDLVLRGCHRVEPPPR